MDNNKLSASEFADNIDTHKINFLTKEICIWGHLYTVPDNKMIQLLSATFSKETQQLILDFSVKTRLIINNPDTTIVTTEYIVIPTADNVNLEWIDLNKSDFKNNTYYLNFTKNGNKVTGKNNVHWSYIDVSKLSVNKPAVIIR